MIVRKFWLPSVSATVQENLPTEYVVETGADVLEPVGDTYSESASGKGKKDMLNLEAHSRAKEFVLCASLCNVAT
jgi:hypothetical protein